MINLAIFASGGGSNAQSFFDYFENHDTISVGCVVTNNPDAAVVDRSHKSGVDVLFLNRKDFYSSEKILDDLKEYQIQCIVLAGFLWLIPAYLITAYPKKIVNIHPSLLPKYGGKGMYGMRVHNAVKANAEKESGLTIHWVNEHYDEGVAIFQVRCPILEKDHAEDIAARILRLEHYYYPRVVAGLF